MSKRKADEELFNPEKKRKTSPSKILGGHLYTKAWLVEWCDMTRTWEPYESVKDMIVFREWLEKLIDDKILSIDQPIEQIVYTECSYII